MSLENYTGAIKDKCAVDIRRLTRSCRWRNYMKRGKMDDKLTGRNNGRWAQSFGADRLGAWRLCERDVTRAKGYASPRATLGAGITAGEGND